MERTRVICANCGGIGGRIVYKIVSEGICKGEEEVCTNCNGKGYIEFAAFTLEEASAILKHCGLTVDD